MTRVSFKDELEQAIKGRSKIDAKLIFLGILNKHLGPRRRAVLVGGSVVEFYTSGAYLTGDIDLVGDKPAVTELLRSAGFKEEGRYSYHTEWSLVVEVPGNSLRPTESVVDIEFEGFRIPCIAVEDSLVDRLLAAKYWRSPTDWEQAVLLYAAHRSRLDIKALRSKAKANDVEDFVDKLIESVSAVEAGSRSA